MKRKWRLKKLKNYPLNQLLICSVFATDSVKSYLICQINQLTKSDQKEDNHTISSVIWYEVIHVNAECAKPLVLTLKFRPISMLYDCNQAHLDRGPPKKECKGLAALYGPSVTTEEVINDYNTYPCQ